MSLTNVLICRPQRDPHVLLSLLNPNHLLSHYRRWCRSCRLRTVSLLRCRTGGVIICSGHLPSDQWFCRFSAVRRWYAGVALDAAALFRCRLADHVPRCSGYFQVLGRTESDQHRGAICSSLPAERHSARDIRCPAGFASSPDFRGPVAPWPHRLRCLLFCCGTSLALRCQLNYLQ